MSKQCFIHELVKDCGRYLLKHEIWKTDETFQIDFSNKDEEYKDNLKEMSPAEKHQCNEYLRKFGLKLLDINIEQQSISLEKTNEHWKKSINQNNIYLLEMLRRLNLRSSCYLILWTMEVK